MKTQLNYFCRRQIYFILFSVFSVFSVASLAQEKGKDADWESAGKQGIGTALSENSKVWFTLEGGSLTEVFYPTADKANVQWLQFVVVNKKTEKIETERYNSEKGILTKLDFERKGFYDKRFKNIIENSFLESIKSKDLRDNSALIYRQHNYSKNKWTITKNTIADTESNTIQIKVRFYPKDKDLQL